MQFNKFKENMVTDFKNAGKVYETVRVFNKNSLLYSSSYSSTRTESASNASSSGIIKVSGGT